MVTNCFQRASFYRENALFVNQKPFKVVKATQRFGSYKEDSYAIYSDNDDQVPMFKAYFDSSIFKLASTAAINSEFLFQDKQGMTNVTNLGKGIKFRLFTTLYSILTDFIKTEDFTYLFFTSELNEPSRVKLYDVFFRKLQDVLSHKFLFYKNSKRFTVRFFLISKEALNNQEVYDYVKDVLGFPQEVI